MTLVELHADLKETNRLLERLCVAVEFAAGMRPVVRPQPAKVTGLEDVSRISNESTLQMELEREAKRENPFRGGGEAA